ncbi:MAG: aromatic ring-hydroxylating dioxygenase subunit alpha [Hyphomonadaceae bacterium]|nr:aromatic ring-hydroxylating dioxygenase subunit alpha [Hyphomonadaceae bacterium]
MSIAVTAPAAWYRDPSCFAIERTRIFAAGWHYAAHDSELPGPGAWRAEEIAGYPILLVRDEAGAVRAFHNVCRHRAGPLVRELSGVCDGALTCQYHGWRYALDGRLRSARDFAAADGFDPRAFSLFPIRAATWRGGVFVNIDAAAAPLAELIAPVEARLAKRDWSRLKAALRRTHVIACNWKVYVENYLEGYHVPTLHPALDADIRAEEYAVTVEGRAALHHAPPRAAGVYDGVWAWVWPNLGINVYQRGVMIERMAPIGAAQTRLDYLYLTEDGEAPAPETLTMSDQVTAEDSWICAQVQANLNAGIYERGVLSPKHEGAVAAFQAWVAAALADTL